ncbi:MAG: tetratricopeptide repeat protein [Verrucomicrobiota bacterium]
MAAGVVLLAVFVAWRASKPAPARSPVASSPGTPAPKREDDAAVFARYAGSQSCRECHAEAFQLWADSHHALAERPLKPEVDRAAFEPAQTFQHGTQQSEARLTNGVFEIVTLGLHRERKAYPIARVIGVDPLRQFLIEAPGGRWQCLEVTLDPQHNEWFDVFGNEDRQPGEWGHWTGRGMNWNTMCAACHNTRLRKNYDEATDSYATAMAEMSVGCEACHGPMADHVRWRRQYPTGTGDPTLRRLSRDQMLDTCGSCHSRRAELTGDFQPGDAYFDHYSLTIPDESDIFYPDGQVRDEDYEFTSFLASRMHAAGVRCIDCHQPHSGKTRVAGDALCMTCHIGQSPALPGIQIPRIDASTHSHHQANEPGGRCVDCHMPLTTYMQRHPRRDHGFTIPDPLLTQQHGIPNACNRCHADKDAAWALDWTQQWYGGRMNRPSRTRAQWVAQARAGDRHAWRNLVALYDGETNSLWRAVAAGLLRNWPEEREASATLLRAARDASPMVRGVAASALEPLASTDGAVRTALTELLNDPVRKVRVDAAWVLRSTVDPQSLAGQDLLRHLAAGGDQPAGAMQLGVYYSDRNQLARALEYFRKAVDWDANSAPLRHEFAVALSQNGQSHEAAAQLQAACDLAPREAEYRFKLALALHELGQLDRATATLEETVRINPAHSQAWYNLGLAYSSLNQPAQALDALARAEALDTRSPRIPYARATVLARLGRTTEARAAAQRALAIHSGYADAAALLEALSTSGRP